MNNSNDFTIRSTIGKYFQSHNGVISSRCVDFESYDSDVFSVYDKFTQEEWNLMFNGVPKKEFDTWNQFYNDRVVFVAYTKTHHEPIGFICLKRNSRIMVQWHFTEEYGYEISEQVFTSLMDFVQLFNYS